MGGIKDAVVNVFNSLLSGIKNAMSGIAGAVKSGFDAAINFIKGLLSQALQWGKDIIGGLNRELGKVYYALVCGRGAGLLPIGPWNTAAAAWQRGYAAKAC